MYVNTISRLIMNPFLALPKDLSEAVMIPPDTVVIINTVERLLLIKEINMCEMKGYMLDTRVIDQLLSLFKTEKCFIFPTYTTVTGGMSPYYGKYIAMHQITNQVELILLPLCDHYHFYGYIIDLKKNSIICIDSMYKPNAGKRSVGAILKNTYYRDDSEVTFMSYYEQRVQFDGHSCGAWLISGMVGYILGFHEYKDISMNREKVFNVLMVLVEDIAIDAKQEKVINIFRKEKVDMKKYKDEKLQRESSMIIEQTRIPKKKHIFYDSSEEEDEERYEKFVHDIKTYSTPEKMEKCCTEMDLLDELSDIVDDEDGFEGDVEMDKIKEEKEEWDESYLSKVYEGSDEEICERKVRLRKNQKVELKAKKMDLENDGLLERGEKRSDSLIETDDDDLLFNEQPRFKKFKKLKPIVRSTPVKKGTEYFLNTEQVLEHLRFPQTILPSIPHGVKENQMYIISNEENNKRRKGGKKSIFFDDCGIWINGTTVRSYFVEETSGLKYVTYKKGVYCTEKKKNSKKVYEEMVPQPTTVLVLNRYYTKLKSFPGYRRRVSWLDDVHTPLVVVEYVGKYPKTVPSHGNAKHQHDEYRRTDPIVLEKISGLSKHQRPRQVYKTLIENDSLNGPKDFKQCQNVAHNTKKKETKISGRRNNFADELLDCMELVDTHEFVQHVYKTKGRLPSFILYTQNQMDDLMYYIKNQDGYALGIDRTFNLGSFFVTAFVYKNLRLVRAENRQEHPLFIGPMFLHRDANFETYHELFSAIKSILCKNNTIAKIEVNLGAKMVIGSDEEKAMTKAIESVFPESRRFVCTKHVKENTINYMKNKAGVPQKDRNAITENIFGKGGITHADSSFSFDKGVQKVLKVAGRYPRFRKYFTDHLQPLLSGYIASSDPKMRNWTNNNCESINHILKMDANWTAHKTRDLIDILHDVTLLHFRDFRRALHGAGNYRLLPNKAPKKKTPYPLSKYEWERLNEDQRNKKFHDFLKNKVVNQDERLVKSSCSDFTVRLPSLAKKLGQRKRVKSSKTHLKK